MSLQAAIEAFENTIALRQFDGYGLESIPSEQDKFVESFVRAYVEAGQSEREVTAVLPDIATQVALAFCERQATLAVRRKSSTALRHSLLAAGVASIAAGDFRDVTLCLVLPWRSAHHLGFDPAIEFISASKRLPPAAAETLLAFTRRASSDQTLDCMGYREVGAAESFRYEREW